MRFLTLLKALPIQTVAEARDRLWGEVVCLAREQDLSVYDATYLDLAVRLELPLATQDERLAQAAQRCGASVLRP
ncbi:MAG: type II toxin-antitoxin system VapC family toxin [Gloeomargarita sp. SKYBB_i_bin120]|nr:type II toxin-antitoxin system VapC family toxin [Gloeomargarita sp. SKYB120]MDW8179168.1 type II toxin-antitoxin system VapC family toxin [Gloeomargarita sp. SKYBB_i_bin120]